MQFRNLPSVDRVLNHSRIRPLLDTFTREWIVSLIRERLDIAREAVRTGASNPSLDHIIEWVTEQVQQIEHPHPSYLINATGIIIHTNLGRAPLSKESMDGILAVASGYSNLELELKSGKRGSRQHHAQSLLRKLTGAQAALIVNNNASAVLLGISALAKGGEILVSRGEAIEIGGGFRIPDILEYSGATLVEVGTTNRTYVEDYDRKISANTVAILKIHPSNFRISGFCNTPSIAELGALGNWRGIPVLHDLGSGCLLDTEKFDLIHEPTPQESISGGANLVFFSGDKLLGGPQSGIIVGDRTLVERLSYHPLARAIRIDKINLAALIATLKHYVRKDALEMIPIWRMIAATPKELHSRAQRWQQHLGDRAMLLESTSSIGGGSLPEETLRTWVIALKCNNSQGSAESMAAQLRANNPPIIPRIQANMLLLDTRTVLPEEESQLLTAVTGLLNPSVLEPQ